MRNRVLTIRSTVGALALVAGCLGSERLTEPSVAVPEVPRLSVGSFEADCRLTQEQCRIIRDGIDAMMKHANWTCRSNAYMADLRFNSTFGDMGFRPGDNAIPINLMYVQNAGTTSVNDSFWRSPYSTNPNDVGAVVVHEEEHHKGDASDDKDHKMFEMCRNPQP